MGSDSSAYLLSLFSYSILLLLWQSTTPLVADTSEAERRVPLVTHGKGQTLVLLWQQLGLLQSALP